MKMFLVSFSFLVMGCAHQTPVPAVPSPEVVSTSATSHQVCVVWTDAAYCVRTITLPSGERKVELIQK